MSRENLGLMLNLLGLASPVGALAGLDGMLIGERTRDLLLSLLEARLSNRVGDRRSALDGLCI
jgi:xanthosine utilization system XapX-like protein